MEYAGVYTIAAAGITIGLNMIRQVHMFYKLKNVWPLSDYQLLVEFENGEQKRYDVKPLFDKWEPFKVLLMTKGLFEQVRVDAGSYAVSWNDDIDLSCNELFINGVTAESPKNGEY